MIAGIQIAILAVLLIGCSNHSQAESIDDAVIPPPPVVNGRAVEELDDMKEIEEDVPKCIDGRCKFDLDIVSWSVVPFKLKGKMEIGYAGGADNKVSGSSHLSFETNSGREGSFGLTTEIDCKGEDQISFRIGVGAGGTIRYYRVNGNIKKKLPPICIPIPGLTVVSLCTYLTKYEYHEADKSLEICLLFQLRVQIIGPVGFKIANLHNRCMFLRRDHFNQIGNKFKATHSFTMRQANNLQQMLQRTFSRRGSQGTTTPTESLLNPTAAVTEQTDIGMLTLPGESL